jgi:signal peptidase I
VLSRIPLVTHRRRATIAVVLLSAVLAGCSVFAGRTYRMQTLDMSPTIPKGMELSLQSETSVHRGDIVAFKPPGFLELHGVNYLLRRVVGLPGETISARDGRVVVDSRALSEPYLPRGTFSPEFKAVRIPAGHYFVLGDDRRTALDSRRFGPVSRTDIVGRATD